MVDARTWNLVWCHEGCHRMACEAQREVLKTAARERGVSCVWFKKADKAALWLAQQRSSPFILLADWRELKPCISLLMEYNLMHDPRLIFGLCSTEKQFQRASTWVGKNSQGNVHVRRTTELKEFRKSVVESIDAIYLGQSRVKFKPGMANIQQNKLCQQGTWCATTPLRAGPNSIKECHLSLCAGHACLAPHFGGEHHSSRSVTAEVPSTMPCTISQDSSLTTLDDLSETEGTHPMPHGVKSTGMLPRANSEGFHLHGLHNGFPTTPHQVEASVNNCCIQPCSVIVREADCALCDPLQVALFAHTIGDTLANHSKHLEELLIQAMPDCYED